MLNVIEVVKKTSEFFASKGVESPRLNAELIVGHALGLARMSLYINFERPVSEAELAAIRELVRRRGKREPLQYVIGFAEFSGLRLKTDRRALIPRPETELLVETLGARCAPPPARVLDLGTGSGAIALGLAKAVPRGAGDGRRLERRRARARLRERAGDRACRPCALRQVELVRGAARGRDLRPRRVEPPVPVRGRGGCGGAGGPRPRAQGALASGEEGFEDVGRIIAGSPGFLAPGGLLALETGIAHHGLAAASARAAGFSRTESLRDLTGRDRFFLAWR